MRRLLLVSIPLLSSAPLLLEPPSYQERIRGTYENKIRQNASPEKVFETFASMKENRKFFMSPQDLFKAITPFNYSPTSAYDFFKDRESFIISIVDANKDGKISFPEYFFFIVLLSTTKVQFEKMFRKRGGRLGVNGFTEIMLEAKRISPQGKRLVSSNGLEPRSTFITDQDFEESCKNLLSEIFGEGAEMDFQTFLDIRQRISQELFTYEFYRFPVEEESISAEDFAKSIIAYIPASLTDMYLKRLSAINPTGRISLKEYLGFMFVFQETHLLHQELIHEHHRSGALGKTKLTNVLRKVLQEVPNSQEKGFCIGDEQVEVFLKLLDLDESGTLEPNEIMYLVSSKGSQTSFHESNPNLDEVVHDFKRFVNSLMKFAGVGPVFKMVHDDN
jgi:Ca2+-binding EF-hand superfamily protein